MAQRERLAGIGVILPLREFLAMMRPMREFDPDRPCRVHDVRNDRMHDWHTGWADKYRRFAVLERNGVAYFEGLMIDGWEPMAGPS